MKVGRACWHLVAGLGRDPPDAVSAGWLRFVSACPEAEGPESAHVADRVSVREVALER